jgi:hypothetical protein
MVPDSASTLTLQLVGKAVRAAHDSYAPVSGYQDRRMFYFRHLHDWQRHGPCRSAGDCTRHRWMDATSLLDQINNHWRQQFSAIDGKSRQAGRDRPGVLQFSGVISRLIEAVSIFAIGYHRAKPLTVFGHLAFSD